MRVKDEIKLNLFVVTEIKNSFLKRLILFMKITRSHLNNGRYQKSVATQHILYECTNFE